MSLLATPWPLVAGAILTTAAGFAGGWLLADRLADGRVARMEARRIECEHAREADAREAAEKTAALLARAQEAEAEAARRLAAAEAAADRKLKETRREIYRLATGRECLSGPVRLRLNAALAPAGRLPAGAGDADPADAAAATDTDVAAWALDAAALYEQCRARMDAIRQWDAMTFGEAHGR